MNAGSKAWRLTVTGPWYHWPEPGKTLGAETALVVEAGASVFRRFALEHPALFRLGVQHMAVSEELALSFRGAAEHALDGLRSRIARLADARQLGSRSVAGAVCEFHALCEGLAALELRTVIPQNEAERIWRDALAALVAGWRAT